MAVTDRRRPRLAVVGLGKLGAPMAAVFAVKGFEVIGVDLNPAYVDAINGGIAPVDEPQLQDFIDRSSGRLRATTDFAEAVAHADITFVIVPTPSGADHHFRNDYVVDAVRRIGAALRRVSHDHMVVVTSTVMPGSTGGVIRDALEQSSGRTVGESVGLCYSPEFIALGTVVRDLLNPDMVLIGECSVQYGDRLEEVYRTSTDSNPSVQRMAFVNAEVCKIAVNTFVTTKISYANMLADLCAHLDGADVDVISTALGADTRIGRKYLKGGVAFGGPCFPRDNKAFVALAQALGVRCDIAEATDRINDHQVHRLFGAIEACVAPGARIAILGLSYKPHTPVVEKSQGLTLARLLLESNYQVLLADPLGAQPARAELGGDVTVTGFDDAVRAADMVVITTPLDEIRALAPDTFARPTPLPVLDPWGLLMDTPIADVARVITPGRAARRVASPPAVRTRLGAAV